MADIRSTMPNDASEEYVTRPEASQDNLNEDNFQFVMPAKVAEGPASQDAKLHDAIDDIKTGLTTVSAEREQTQIDAYTGELAQRNRRLTFLCLFTALLTSTLLLIPFSAKTKTALFITFVLPFYYLGSSEPPDGCNVFGVPSSLKLFLPWMHKATISSWIANGPDAQTRFLRKVDYMADWAAFALCMAEGTFWLWDVNKTTFNKVFTPQEFKMMVMLVVLNRVWARLVFLTGALWIEGGLNACRNETQGMASVLQDLSGHYWAKVVRFFR